MGYFTEAPWEAWGRGGLSLSFVAVKYLKTLLESALPEKALLHLHALDHYMNGEQELRLLAALCPPGCLAIDAGANIGTYSYFLRRVASKVHAYEPNPSLAQRLRRLMPDVVVRDVALSDQPAELVLRIPTDPDGRMRHELASVAADDDGPAKEHRVQAITIDSEQLQGVGFIKVDVERHERQVLRGAHETITRWRPVMLVEVYPLRYQEPLAVEFAFITDTDYTAWFYFDGRWLPLSSLVPAKHTNAADFGDPKRFIGNNLLFFPNEHDGATGGPRT
jgi:FkbM family methyltransferase